MLQNTTEDKKAHFDTSYLWSRICSIRVGEIGLKRSGQVKNMLAFAVSIVCIAHTTPLWAATITVGPSGDQSTISAAISVASSGDTITIQNGVYMETVSTTKTGLTITGESRSGVIWTGMSLPVGAPSWSKTSGYTSIYQTTSSLVAESDVVGIVDDMFTGMYRRKANLTDVDAIPGTLFTTGGILYVHTSDNNSPTDHTLWYTTNAYLDIFRIGGGVNISNITFVGATEYGLWIRGTTADIGTNTVTNCVFRAFGSSTAVGGAAIAANVTGGGTAGTLTVSNSDFLYNVSPTYDSNYSIFTDAQGSIHTYQGAGVSTNYFNTVNIEDSVFRYAREVTSDAGTVNFNIRRSIMTDIAVHPSMHNMASYNTLRIENCIYSMYGSTTGPRASSSSAGFVIYLINNTIYTGENPQNGSSDKMWFSATDSSATNVPSAVYIYNNLFIRDMDASGNNGVPLELYNMTLDKINMDNNVFTYGRTGGSSLNYNFVRFGGSNYTLSEWQTYTTNQGNAKDASSLYLSDPTDMKFAEPNYQDTGSRNFGKILGSSAAIDQGNATYAPATDLTGTIRPLNSADDIGAYEYISGDSTMPSKPLSLN